MSADKPITMITVLCDARRIQRIALTCRCAHKWVELVPQELHDSDMIARFACSSCGQEYDLHHKQLTRVTKTENNNDGSNVQTTRFGTIDTSRYDS